MRFLQELFRITTVEQLSAAGHSEKDWYRNLSLFPMVPECDSQLPVITLLPADQFKNHTKMDLKNIMKI